MERMFNPRTIAFIGATEKEGSIGQQIMKNLLIGKEKKTIYPVNPNRESVMGLKCYPNITEVPEQVDLAIIATPAKTVPKIVDDCGRRKVAGIVIISAGFRETGEEGKKIEDEIRQLAKKYSIKLLGPNCLGFIRPHENLNAAFSRSNPEPGGIAFLSQSAALGSAMLEWAVSVRIGFSMFASLGSMLDIDFGDMIDYLGRDPYTRSILIYMEGVGSAKKFVSAARGFARTKPILILKSGKHAVSARAAQSHVGALAGSFEVYDAAFKRLGVLRVEEIEDLFNCASVLSSRHLPGGPRLGIITNAGGPGIMASDAVIDHGGEVATLSKKSMEALEGFLPSYWSKGNPIDILEEADSEKYLKALDVCLSDPNIDGIIIIYTPQPTTRSTELAKKIIEKAKKKVKPVLTTWMGGTESQEARTLFHSNEIPTYLTPEKAVKTYMYMYRYKRNLELLYETPEELPTDLSPPRNHLKLMIKRAIKEGRTVLTPEEADKFLDAYRIPRAEAYLAKNEDDAIRVASNIGYPVVLKAISPSIIHKSDVGGIILDVDSPEELKTAYQRLLESIRPVTTNNSEVEGVYVQKMITNIDYELILGARRDKDFGSIILFGQGGRGVEFIQDFSMALPPLNQTLARRMMEETRIYQALTEGIRERAPVNMQALEEIVVQFSNMIADFPEIAEFEINPLSAHRDDVQALDTRMVVDPNTQEDQNPHPHLMILPYPTKYVTPWRLRNETEVLLRPIRPEDEKFESEFVKSLSNETKRFRFFRIFKDLTHIDLARFCNIDYDREIAIIAEHREGERKKEIGAATLIIEADRNCGEIGVVVADKFQRKGLGTKLMDMVIGIAEERGLEHIYGIILPENESMLRICKKMGFTIKKTAEEFSHFKSEVTPMRGLVLQY